MPAMPGRLWAVNQLCRSISFASSTGWSHHLDNHAQRKRLVGFNIISIDRIANMWEGKGDQLACIGGVSKIPDILSSKC